MQRFGEPDAAILYQRMMAVFCPGSVVRVFLEQGRTLTLIAADWQSCSTPGSQDQLIFTRLKGGGKRMANGRESNGPVKKFMAGAVSAALWSHTTTLKDGRSLDLLSVSLDRRYKDSDGEWKSTGSFKENDIPKAMLVLAKAYEFMTSKDDDDYDGPGA